MVIEMLDPSRDDKILDRYWLELIHCKLLDTPKNHELSILDPFL
ncbi:hypothetical protein [Enterococcus faecium]